TVARSFPYIDTFPISPSSSGVTPAAGPATEWAAATEAAAARGSLPAPTRRAASPDRTTAPGVPGEPPTTTTAPRPYFPVPGSGSGHPRRTVGVSAGRSGPPGGRPAVLTGPLRRRGRRGPARPRARAARSPARRCHAGDPRR